MPAAAQPPGGFPDGAALPADLPSGPPCRPDGQQPPPRGLSEVLLSERLDSAVLVGARPTAFPPRQPRRPSERGKIDQLHHPGALQPDPASATRARRTPRPPPDFDLDASAQGSPTPRTSTSPKPTKTSHMRVGLRCTGVLLTREHFQRPREHFQRPIMEDPCPDPGIPLCPAGPLLHPPRGRRWKDAAILHCRCTKTPFPTSLHRQRVSRRMGAAGKPIAIIGRIRCLANQVDAEPTLKSAKKPQTHETPPPFNQALHPSAYPQNAKTPTRPARPLGPPPPPPLASRNAPGRGASAPGPARGPELRR